MEDFKFVPGGRVLAGAGTGYAVTFYNCFVIPSPKDSRGGILDTLKQMVEIVKAENPKNPDWGKRLESIVQERLEQARGLQPEKAVAVSPSLKPNTNPA